MNDDAERRRATYAAEDRLRVDLSIAETKAYEVYIASNNEAYAVYTAANNAAYATYAAAKKIVKQGCKNDRRRPRVS